MVLGKKVAILTGNGAEIRPLEMGRKGPEGTGSPEYLWFAYKKYGSG